MEKLELSSEMAIGLNGGYADLSNKNISTPRSPSISCSYLIGFQWLDSDEVSGMGGIGRAYDETKSGSS